MIEASVRFLSTQALEWFRAICEGFMQDAVQTPVYAATITPTLEFSDTKIIPGILTGNVTIANPIGARRGMRLTFVFTQDGTGSRTVTWGAAFGFAANGAGTANQIGATSFVYNGTRWVQESGALAFKA
jgi:hypothetical protein